MGLIIYNLEQCDEWDEIVRSFRNYDTYWLSGYVKAFFIHGDGTPLLVYYQDEDVRGINVVMKRDISEAPLFCGKLETGRYFDFSSPYGYGGWITEGNKTESLFAVYDTWCKKNGIVSEFVRFHPLIENHKVCESYYDVLSLGKTVTMDLSSPEIIWNNLTSKNRNMIRKAKKNGVTVYRGRSPEIFKEFREIYNRTMDRDHAEQYYYFGQAFYDSILNDLPRNAQIFYAVYAEKTVAASIMLSANGYMNYHLSGSLKEYAVLAPTNMILYEAALWGCANGYRTLYLGGGVGSGEDSLYKFKKAFDRQDDDRVFHIGRKIFVEETYGELLKMHGSTDSSYFPKYRA